MNTSSSFSSSYLPSLSSSVVFKDHDFRGSWTDQVLSVGGSSATARVLVDHVSTGGRDGGAFRQHIQQWGKAGIEPVAVCVVQHTNKQATYRPSEKGGILSIDFDCGLMSIGQSTETHFALLLEQNNVLYVSKKTLSTKHEKWNTFSINSLKSTDFRKLIPTESHSAGTLEEHPNFTMLGNELRFGYATICSTSQSHDEAVSGMDFWRVTIYHENAESAHMGTRLLQLEHNTGILLQELVEARRGAANIQHELAAQRVALEAKQKEADCMAAQLLQHEMESPSSFSQENRTPASSEELAPFMVTRSAAEVEECDRELNTLRARCKNLEGTLDEYVERERAFGEELNRKQIEIESLRDQLRHKEFEVKELRAETGKAVDAARREMNCAVQEALAAMTATKQKYEEMVEVERRRRADAEQALSSGTASLQAELRNLYSKMESDVNHEREMRVHLEKSHRSQLSKLEEATRAEKLRVEEAFARERIVLQRRDEQLLTEKRNLEAALQAATTTKDAAERNLQQLSSQINSINSLHRSEMERAAELESKLLEERETKDLLIERTTQLDLELQKERDIRDLLGEDTAQFETSSSEEEWEVVEEDML